MPRPEKLTVDYFQHDCVPKKTLFILEEKYKNDGYTFWYKLLELLGSSTGHYYNLNNKSNLEFLASKTRVSESQCLEMLDLLCRLEAIDCELWKKKVIWSQNFVDRLSHVYTKRIKETPLKPNTQLLKKLILNGRHKVSKV